MSNASYDLQCIVREERNTVFRKVIEINQYCLDKKESARQYANVFKRMKRKNGVD